LLVCYHEQAATFQVESRIISIVVKDRLESLPAEAKEQNPFDDAEPRGCTRRLLEPVGGNTPGRESVEQER